jgi:SAM-dependent methyltransferase
MIEPAKTDAWLARVFGASDAQELARSYDQWAETYDADMLAIGYLNPAIACSLLARHVTDRGGAILDAGCGTGLIGEILSLLGYRTLAGLDISAGMLERARRRGIYADLRNGALGAPLDYADGAFAAVICCGVFTAGHAPAHAVDELVRITRGGGRLVLTIASSAWEAGGFKDRIEALERAGRWRLLEATPVYRPMPYSEAKGSATSRTLAFGKL